MVTDRFSNELTLKRDIGYPTVQRMAALLGAHEDTPSADFEFALKYIEHMKELKENNFTLNKNGFPYSEFENARKRLVDEKLKDTQLKGSYTSFCNSLKRSMHNVNGETRDSGEFLLTLARELHPDFDEASLEA
jgi:hypothetical protein